MPDILERFRADAATRGRIPAIAAASGVNAKTLYNLRKYPGRDPRASIVDKLRAYYERDQEAA